MATRRSCTTVPLPGDTAPGFGGALLIIAGSTVHVDNGQFKNNIAGNSGGAIYNDRDSQLVITSSQFAANQAQGLFAGGGGYGGAIASEGNVTLSNSTLASNASKEGGGALSTNVGNATISNSTLSNNSSKNGRGRRRLLWHPGSHRHRSRQQHRHAMGWRSAQRHGPDHADAGDDDRQSRFLWWSVLQQQRCGPGQPGWIHDQWQHGLGRQRVRELRHGQPQEHVSSPGLATTTPR